MKKQLLSLQRSWIITDKQINTEHEIVLGRIQLLLGGQADLSVEVHVLSVLCVICGKAFTLSLLRCQSGPSMHATVGGVGIRGEQGLAFACGTKKPTTQHGAPPPLAHSPSLNPTEAPPHPPCPSVLAAPLPAYQKYAWRNNGRSIHTRNLECV